MTINASSNFSDCKKLIFEGNLKWNTFTCSPDLFLDCGADSLFIDHEYVKKFRIPTLRLRQPIILRMADESESTFGLITHETVPLQLKMKDHIETYTFFITALPHPVILGLE